MNVPNHLPVPTPMDFRRSAGAVPGWLRGYSLLSLVLLLASGCVRQQSPPPGGHVFTVSAPTGKLALAISLPPDYAVRHQEGPDFDVYYFSQAAAGTNRIGVYVGCCPGLQSKEAGVAQVQRAPGRIGKSSIEWLRWSQGGEQHSEALVPGLSDGIIVHIFIAADTEPTVLALEEAAATLRLERAK